MYVMEGCINHHKQIDLRFQALTLFFAMFHKF